MGTNFYLKQHVSEQAKDECRDILEKVFAGEAELYDITKILERIKSYDIHLGKRSYGWQFHWQEHRSLYEENLESIKKFLIKSVEDGGRIVNEYGDEFTVDQFFDEEIGESMYAHTGKNADGSVRHFYNAFTYYEDNPQEHPAVRATDYEYITEDGLRFSKGDFC